MNLSKVVLNDIGTLANGASARQALNDNFQKIEDEFKKVVYRDGSTPNSMEADLDMDSNRILNVADAIHDKDAVNKGQVADIAYEAAEVLWQPRFDDFVNHVDDELSRALKLDGAGTYNANGNHLRGLPYASTTDEAVPLGQVLDQIQTAVSNPNTELFLQNGNNPKPRTITDKARETVTPEDFNGTDSERINAATDSGNAVVAGTYEIDSPVLVYDNQLVAGNLSGTIKLANGASVTAMLQSASYSDEDNYPTVSYNYKFRPSIRDLVLDMNRNNGTSGDGIVLTTLNGWFENIKIRNVPATSAAVRCTHKNVAGTEMTGNALINWFSGISVENAANEPAGIFFEMGEDYNGRCTDNVMAFCHGYAGHTALHIGSAQGWFLYANRFAQIDDGILTGHANRTRWVGNVVDNFGYGYDTAKTSFIGMDVGSSSATNFANSVAAFNDVMTRGHAGASKTYVGMRFGFGSGTGIVGKAIGLFGNVISAENVTSPVAIVQKNEAVNDGIGMIAHNLLSTDASTDQSFSRANTVQLRSPYVRVKDNINGKRKIDDRQNCHGWINENYNTGAYDFYATGRALNVAPDTASEVLKVHVGAGCTVAGKLEVMAVNDGGSVVGRREFNVLLRKHTSAQLVDGTSSGDTMQVLTNNNTVRDITAMELSIVFPDSPGMTDIVSLRMQTTVTGTDAPAAISYHCVFRGVAKKPNNGVFDLVV